MQTLRLLSDWGWPVVNKPTEFSRNCHMIRRWFMKCESNPRYAFITNPHFVGIGNSGSMIAGGLSLSQSQFGTEFPITIFPKPQVKSTTFQQPRLRGKSIIVIDDHIHVGRTLRTINEALDEQSRIFNADYINQVVAVVANEWNKELPEDSEGNKLGMTSGVDIINTWFPSCKLWIH